MLLDLGDPQVVLDFSTRRVVRVGRRRGASTASGSTRALVEQLIRDHDEDWVNWLFLSCRFEAERRGSYNEYVYSFFKCLSAERIEYAEGCYSEQLPEREFFECAGYRVQRRCPHLKADLAGSAIVEDGILTCTLHGWQFELATGRCLTSDDRRLFCEPLEVAAEK